MGVSCSAWGGEGVFFVGGPAPPRPPKCAHLGAFHEVVRLECVVFGLGGRGFEGVFCVIFDFFVLLSRQEKYPFPSPNGLGGRSWWR